MKQRNFHPKLIISSIYFVLFLSSIFMASVILPALSFFIGGFTGLSLLAAPIPLALGFILSELLQQKKIIHSSMFGSSLIGVASIIGYLSNEIAIKYLTTLAEMIETTTSGGGAVILGNLDTFGTNFPAFIFIAVLAYNIPLLYRYFKSSQETSR